MASAAGTAAALVQCRMIASCLLSLILSTVLRRRWMPQSLRRAVRAHWAVPLPRWPHCKFLTTAAPTAAAALVPRAQAARSHSLIVPKAAAMHMWVWVRIVRREASRSLPWALRACSLQRGCHSRQRRRARKVRCLTHRQRHWLHAGIRAAPMHMQIWGRNIRWEASCEPQQALSPLRRSRQLAGTQATKSTKVLQA